MVETPQFGFGPVKHGKLAEVVAGYIRDEILSGRLPLGERLPAEPILIEMFGVSRATVREALTLLEAEGFVVVRSGRGGGAYITKPRIDRLAAILDGVISMDRTTNEELLEARRLMEPMAVRLASRNSSDEEIERLQECVTLMRDTADNMEVVARETVRFHVLIAESTHNAVIYALTAITQQLIFTRLHDALGSDVQATLAAHQGIVDAVRDRDENLAARRMTSHVAAFEAVAHPPVKA